MSASLATGAAVSLAGPVSFVGIIVPHTVRLLFGTTYRLVLPLSILFGAGFLVLADLLARTALAQMHLARMGPEAIAPNIEPGDRIRLELVSNDESIAGGPTGADTAAKSAAQIRNVHACSTARSQDGAMGWARSGPNPA